MCRRGWSLFLFFKAPSCSENSTIQTKKWTFLDKIWHTAKNAQNQFIYYRRNVHAGHHRIGMRSVGMHNKGKCYTGIQSVGVPAVGMHRDFYSVLPSFILPILFKKKR
jgi:hypothetical protein